MKRKVHEEHLNHEAWAIPYADLMTLLLAFFVVMYAVSVVNEGKYRVLSQSISEAFNGSSHVIVAMQKSRVAAHDVDPAVAAPAGQAGAAFMPILIPIPGRPAHVRMVDSRKEGSKAPPQPSAVQNAGEPQKGGAEDPSRVSPQTALPAQLQHPLPGTAAATAAAAAAAAIAQGDRQQQNLGHIQDQVQRAMQPLIDKKLVVVRRAPNWLEVEIRTDILFPSGVAQLTHPADAVLNSLAAILAPFSNPLRVEGYTDDKPIRTAVYPSNWELSAARAASVARLFADQGVNPNRMGIIGWGEFRPAADNATVEGRNRNRRVLVVVLSDNATPTRFYSDADHASDVADQTSAADASGPMPGVDPASSHRTVDGSRPTMREPGASSLPSPPIISLARAPLSRPETVPASPAAAGSDAPISAAILPVVHPIRPAAAGAGAGKPVSTAKRPDGPLASAPLMLTTGARP